MSWTDRAARELASIDRAGQRRAPRDLDLLGPRGTHVAEGREVVSFASNDYLGLSAHPAVAAAAADAACRWGAGAGSARLIVGSRSLHSALERELADWRGAEAAALFTTGFQANLGALTTLGALASVVCSDELNHASIIDGCRLGRTPTVVYPHADVDAVDRALAEADGPGLVVTDTVFSMDGDVAPVDDLVACCRAHRALLVLDDAHLVFEEPFAPLDDADDVVRVGTLSKALGGLGGFVAGPQSVVDLVVNRARSYIFTTALPPASAASARAALAVVRSDEGAALKRTLRAHTDLVAPGHPSPIVPVVVGTEEDAVAAAARLAEEGIVVPAIRPPTVAPGTSRLRVTLSAAHATNEVEHLVRVLDDLGLRAT